MSLRVRKKVEKEVLQYVYEAPKEKVEKEVLCTSIRGIKRPR
jgi:hypothetical protein